MRERFWILSRRFLKRRNGAQPQNFLRLGDWGRCPNKPFRNLGTGLHCLPLGKLQINRLRLNSGSFAPSVQFGKSEIHTVFLDFSNFPRKQNLSLSALADLFRASLKINARLPINPRRRAIKPWYHFCLFRLSPKPLCQVSINTLRCNGRTRHALTICSDALLRNHVPPLRTCFLSAIRKLSGKPENEVLFPSLQF